MSSSMLAEQETLAQPPESRQAPGRITNFFDYSRRNPVLMTGPGFVTKDNAAKVIAWAKAGYR